MQSLNGSGARRARELKNYALPFIFYPRFRKENGGVSNKCIYAFPLEVKTYIAPAQGRVHGENSLTHSLTHC